MSDDEYEYENEGENEDDDDDEDDDIAQRPLVAKMDIDDQKGEESEDGESENEEDNIDPNLYRRLQEANTFHKFPKDVSKMKAEDIAKLPADMQYEIMSKRRELLVSKHVRNFLMPQVIRINMHKYN